MRLIEAQTESFLYYLTSKRGKLAANAQSSDKNFYSAGYILSICPFTSFSRDLQIYAYVLAIHQRGYS